MNDWRPAAALDPPDQLVLRAARGDVAAFAQIVRLHNEAMTRVAFVVTGDLEAAAGATAEAWLGAWRGLRDAPRSVAIGPWLCSRAAAQAVGAARQTRHGTGPGSPDPGPGGDRAGRGDDDALGQVLTRLAPEDRALLALRHVAGLSLPELQALIRRSRPPVEIRLARLAHALAAPDATGPDPAALDPETARRLLAYADVPVRPVDADATARTARAEASLERTRAISVAIATVVGVIVAVHPYLVGMLFGR